MNFQKREIGEVEREVCSRFNDFAYEYCGDTIYTYFRNPPFLLVVMIKLRIDTIFIDSIRENIIMRPKFQNIWSES